jgi:hypothetical protein
MACFPPIDQPCPLGIDAQRRIAGFCAHCRTAVHPLDGMSVAERAAFLRAAPGPVCVSYRMPRAAIIGLGAVLVLSTIGAPRAEERADVAAAGPPAAEAGPVPATAADAGTAVTPATDEPVLLMGAVVDPAAAAATLDGDDDVPDLPVAHEAGTG